MLHPRTLQNRLPRFFRTRDLREAYPDAPRTPALTRKPDGRSSASREKIEAYLRGQGRPVPLHELAALLSGGRSAAVTALRTLAKQGKVRALDGDYFEAA